MIGPGLLGRTYDERWVCPYCGGINMEQNETCHKCRKTKRELKKAMRDMERAERKEAKKNVKKEGTWLESIGGLVVLAFIIWAVFNDKAKEDIPKIDQENNEYIKSFERQKREKQSSIEDVYKGRFKYDRKALIEGESIGSFRQYISLDILNRTEKYGEKQPLFVKLEILNYFPESIDRTVELFRKLGILRGGDYEFLEMDGNAFVYVNKSAPYNKRFIGVKPVECYIEKKYCSCMIVEM